MRRNEEKSYNHNFRHMKRTYSSYLARDFKDLFGDGLFKLCAGSKCCYLQVIVKYEGQVMQYSQDLETNTEMLQLELKDVKNACREKHCTFLSRRDTLSLHDMEIIRERHRLERYYLVLSELLMFVKKSLCSVRRLLSDIVCLKDMYYEMERIQLENVTTKRWR